MAGRQDPLLQLVAPSQLPQHNRLALRAFRECRCPDWAPPSEFDLVGLGKAQASETF